MKSKLSVIIAGALLLAGNARAELQVLATGINLPAAPQAAPRAAGFVWKAVKDGAAPYESTLLSVSAGQQTWRNSDGCKWTRDDRLMSPSTRWDDCDGRSGKASVSYEGGETWPMKVGNTWSYDMDGGEWRTDRDCEVEETARVRIVAGEFDTFKVVCTDRWNTRTWYYAPALGYSVHFEKFHRKRLDRLRLEYSGK